MCSNNMATQGSLFLFGWPSLWKSFSNSAFPAERIDASMNLKPSSNTFFIQIVQQQWSRTRFLSAWPSLWIPKFCKLFCWAKWCFNELKGCETLRNPNPTTSKTAYWHRPTCNVWKCSLSNSKGLQYFGDTSMTSEALEWSILVVLSVTQFNLWH